MRNADQVSTRAAIKCGRIWTKKDLGVWSFVFFDVKPYYFNVKLIKEDIGKLARDYYVSRHWKP